MADFELEKTYYEKGHAYIAGVDEVGRGALCGPVVAVSVIFPPAWIAGTRPGWLERIKDSKLLTPSQRRELARSILAAADSVGVGSCTNLEVDQKNIYWASLEAMRRAVAAMSRIPDLVLVDGFLLRDFPFRQKAIRQGDRKSATIAAASIVAKVLRDEIMVSCDRLAAGYALGRNKGYGTKEHYRALDELGPTPFHRKSFKLRSDRMLFG